jgi:butyryl-CoA dehydrogenase
LKKEKQTLQENNMIDESYNEIRNMVAKFSDNDVAPLAAAIDREEEIPKALIQKLADNGFLGSYVPEEYGGAGLDYLSYSMIVEEISRSCASTGVFISAHTSLCIWPILEFGTEEQKKKYLPKLASGEWIGCFCLSEPGAGTDAGSLTTFAKDMGDHYEIDGVKNWITNGKEADIAIVFAKTTKTDDYKGMSAFIVETNSPGYSIVKVEEKLGIKGSSTCQLAFDKVKVPKENLLAPEGKGFKVAMATLDGGRIGIASQALGIAEGAFRYATRYATERVQFGKPISTLQAIQIKIAQMSTRIAASRLLVYQASELKDRKMPFTKQSAQAKLFAAQTAMWVTTEAIQVLGGNGYTKEYPVERFFRDAKITEIYEGSSEIQHVVIATCEFKEIQ